MKRILLSAAAGLILAGCASTENGRVAHRADGTHYGLDDQPQSSLVGEGTLMPGAYDPRHMPTGQFTGKERNSDVIGELPTLPREADARQMDNSRAPQPQLGTGAGALGQAGIGSGQPAVTGSDLLQRPLNPGAQPSASDIYRPSDRSAVGHGPTVEVGSSNTNNPTVPSRVDEKVNGQ